MVHVHTLFHGSGNSCFSFYDVMSIRKTLHSHRKVWISRSANSNKVGIIFPLVEIGSADLLKSGGTMHPQLEQACITRLWMKKRNNTIIPHRADFIHL